MDPAGVERAAWTEKAARTRVHQRAGAGQLGSWAEAAVQCGGLSSGRCDEREGVMGGWGGGQGEGGDSLQQKLAPRWKAVIVQFKK